MSQPPSPSFTKAQFIRADVVAMRMSAASASANPPPAAAPWTSAMIGCGQRRISITISAIRRCESSDSGAPRHRMLEIEAGAERPSRALQHHHAGCPVALQALKIVVERLDQIWIERIEVFRAIERHPVDPVVMFDQQRFCHAPFLFIVVPAKAGTHNHRTLLLRKASTTLPPGNSAGY